MNEHYKIILSEEEKQSLKLLTSQGKHSSSKVINALILLNCDQSKGDGSHKTSREIAQMLGVGERKIDNIKKRCVQQGLEAALVRKPPDRQYPHKVDGELEARLIAMSCSQAPDGYARWSLKLLASQAVQLQYVDSISSETVRRTLKKTNLSLGSRSAG